MKRPVVGVIGNTQRVENRFATQAVGERNMRAVADIAGALPLMFASTPEITDVGALLDAVDGILLTGARANVHPSRFGCEPHPKHEPYDDALARVEDALPVQRIDPDGVAAIEPGENAIFDEMHGMPVGEDDRRIGVDLAILEPRHAVVHAPGQFADLGV